MEAYARNEEGCPKLLDLIPNNREWMVKMEKETSPVHSEEKKLELRLGPPDGDWTNKGSSKTMFKGDESLLPFGSFANTFSGNKRGFTDTVKDHVFLAPWSSKGGGGGHHQQETKASFLQLKSSSQCLPVMSKESSSLHCGSGAKGAVELQTGEKKAFSPPSANTAVPTSGSCHSAQKRNAPAPVVGWPPVRSFRRNLASTSNLKPATASQNGTSNKICNHKPVETAQKGMFVKINMDGIPIGRKVDLQAYDSYEKLSSAVDELFRGLLAAQSDPAVNGVNAKGEGEKIISGLLDGSGEYTLVYEDNEGDRMLVGDVPWHMFVSTAKRLRVLKTSEISSLRRGSKQREALS